MYGATSEFKIFSFYIYLCNTCSALARHTGIMESLIYNPRWFTRLSEAGLTYMFRILHTKSQKMFKHKICWTWAHIFSTQLKVRVAAVQLVVDQALVASDYVIIFFFSHGSLYYFPKIRFLSESNWSHFYLFPWTKLACKQSDLWPGGLFSCVFTTEGEIVVV